MIKLFILILAFNNNYSSFNSVEFHSLRDCEAALAQVKANSDKKLIGTCVEKNVPKKRMNCKIINNTSYINKGWGNLNHYPFAEGIICEEIN